MMTTLEGVACAKCSYWNADRTHHTQVRHANIAAVRACFQEPAKPVTPPTAPIRGTERNGAMPGIWSEIRKLGLMLPRISEWRTNYYAIQVRNFGSSDGGLVTEFYKVWHGDQPGFVSLYKQAGDDFYQIKNPHRMLAVLQAIAFNPEKAATDYGVKIKRCGICHRTLTVKASRERGIGPKCAAKAGW
jgi:hypothetical protein